MIRNPIQNLLLAGALFTSLISGVVQADSQISNGGERDVRMSCDFSGSFGDGKSGGGFAMYCHAMAKFEMVEHHDYHWHVNPNDKSFIVVCDDQPGYDRDDRDDRHGRDAIYHGPLTYGFLPQVGNMHGQVDGIFTGDKTTSPKIVVQDIATRHLAGDRAGASLNFRNNGWEYTLFGECRFSDRRDQEPPLK